MTDYSDLGYDDKLRKQGLATKERPNRLAYRWDIYDEKSPYAPPVLISKGTLQTQSGGQPFFRSTGGTSGGTIIMDVDPDTGTVTIRGGLVADQTLNLGTVINTKFAGTPELIGTLLNSTLINNGTWNNGTFGTPAITGGTVTNAVVNAPTIGSPAITSGTLTTSVINNSTVGTPAITGGTGNTMTLGTPTIIRPTIDGTANLDINAGSTALGANGDFELQTFGSAVNIVIRHGGTTFRFNPTGTI